MGKYDKYFQFSEKQKENSLKEILLLTQKKLDDNNIELKNISEYEKWNKLGINMLETAFIGPFTTKDLLSRLGLDWSEYQEPKKQVALLESLDELIGVLKLENKQTKGINTIEYSKEAKTDMETLAKNDGKYKLSRWDKFCAFLGIKTNHALQVETNKAEMEAYKEKQQELAKKVMTKQVETKKNKFIENNKEAYLKNKEIVDAVKENTDTWNKIFFGDKQVPDYIFENGTKVSALSLCLAYLQQHSKKEIAQMDPKEFMKEIENDEKKKQGIQNIAKKISYMSEKKDNISKRAPGMKYLDDFLFEKNNDVKSFDDIVKKMVSPVKENLFKITIKENDRSKETFSKTCIMFKMKDDMLKIFDKNDETYGIKDKETLNMEKHIKNTLKVVNLYEAIKEEKYDKLINNSAFKNDYNKLNQALDFSNRHITKMLNEIKEPSIEEKIKINPQIEEFDNNFSL